MNTFHSSIKNLSLTLTLLAVLAGATFAQDSDEKAKSKAVAAKNQKSSSDNAAKRPEPRPATTKTIPVKLSVEQQDGALEFARKHHPELAALLEKLRKSSPDGFHRGVRSVHSAVQRLTRMQEKQPARFQIELRNWKTDSQIRLLTARWAVSQNKKLEGQIQKLMRQRQESRLNQMKAERERLAERLAQLDAKIGMGTADLEADLKAEWDQLKKRTTSSVRNRREAGKKTTAKQSEAKPDDSSRSAKLTDQSQPTKSKAKSKSPPKTRAKEDSGPTS